MTPNVLDALPQREGSAFPFRRAWLSVFSLGVACGGSAAPANAPQPAPAAAAGSSSRDVAPESEAGMERGRLPRDTRPTAEALVLSIDPKSDQLAGVADIDVVVDRARRTLWMHGKDLKISRATITPRGGEPVEAEWRQVDPGGAGTLTLARAIPAGTATVHVEYAAALGERRHMTQGASYVVAQLEPIEARAVFPCFDEPSFKIPFDVTIVTPRGNEVISNSQEARRTDEVDRGAGPLRADRTAPELPRDVRRRAVRRRPGARPRAPWPSDAAPRASSDYGEGRGPEAAYALASVGPLLGILEDYFGLEYPFEKLDLIAVPGGNGSLENPGAVTFAEAKLLLDPTHASVASKRGFARTMAHELAHQWVGDLVTAAWWDDIWLNEAFATFVGSRAADRWDPSTAAQTDLLRDVQSVMGADSLESTPSIRAKVSSTDDIVGALGSRVDAKGAAVLVMFERLVGDEVFRRGLRTYLEAHRFGAAVAEDFLTSESIAAGWDVASAMRTFLDQSGSPFSMPSSTATATRSCTSRNRASYLSARVGRWTGRGSCRSSCATVSVIGSSRPRH